MTTDPSSAVAVPYHVQVWNQPFTLDQLNARIHDCWPIDRLEDRAHLYHSTTAIFFPQISLGPNPSAIDVGSGVGWPIQAFLKRHPSGHIVGLDISESMIRAARARLAAVPDLPQSWSIEHYDGRTFPFADGTFDFAYSYATLWHLPQSVYFNTVREMLRVVKPSGWVAFTLLPAIGLPGVLDTELELQLRHDPDRHPLFFHCPVHTAVICAGWFGGRQIMVRQLKHEHLNLTFIAMAKTGEPYGDAWLAEAAAKLHTLG